MLNEKNRPCASEQQFCVIQRLAEESRERSPTVPPRAFSPRNGAQNDRALTHNSWVRNGSILFSCFVCLYGEYLRRYRPHGVFLHPSGIQLEIVIIIERHLDGNRFPRTGNRKLHRKALSYVEH